MTKEKKESEYVYLYPLNNMAIGFGNSTETVHDLIENQMKQKLYIKHTDVEERRKNYQRLGEGFRKNFNATISKETLFNPEKSPLNIKSINKKYTPPAHTEIPPFIDKLHGENSIWSLRTFYIPYFNLYEFDIAIQFNGKKCSSFNPLSIQQIITTKFGYSVYKDWKKLVLSDLDSLRELIRAVQDVIKKPHNSVTCCKQSESLCKRAGLPVVNHYAFLVPSKFTN